MESTVNEQTAIAAPSIGKSPLAKISDPNIINNSNNRT